MEATEILGMDQDFWLGVRKLPLGEQLDIFRLLWGRFGHQHPGLNLPHAMKLTLGITRRDVRVIVWNIKRGLLVHWRRNNT